MKNIYNIRIRHPRQADGSTGALIDTSFLAWARHLDSLMLVVFIFGSMFLSGYNQLRTIGITLCAVYLLTHLPKIGRVIKHMRPIPLEIVCYTAWVIWAGLTGALVADDLESFGNAFKVVLQNAVLVWVIWGILNVRKDATVGVFLAIIAGGLVQIVQVLIAGIPKSGDSGAQRVTGLTDNPNGLGFLMIYTIFALLFLWGIPSWAQKRTRRISAVGLFVMCAYVVIASGSRKSFIALCLLVTGWLLFVLSTRRTLWAHTKRLIVVCAIVVFGFYLLPTLVEDTLVGKRFAEFMEKGGGTIRGAAESNIRYEMYRDGLAMFRDYPLFGVGLNNFRTHFYMESYSHSDYIEALASTGLIGFVLYQSFFFLVLWRALRLAKAVRIGFSSYVVRVITVCMLTILWLGTGTVHYDQPMIYILLATFSVLLRQVENEISPSMLIARRNIGAHQISRMR